MDLNELFEYLYVTGQVDEYLGLNEEDLEEDIDLEDDDYNYTR